MTDIFGMDLPPRIAKALQDAGILNVVVLRGLKPSEIKEIDGIGPKAADTIMDALHALPAPDAPPAAAPPVERAPVVTHEDMTLTLQVRHMAELRSVASFNKTTIQAAAEYFIRQGLMRTKQEGQRLVLEAAADRGE